MKVTETTAPLLGLLVAGSSAVCVYVYVSSLLWTAVAFLVVFVLFPVFLSPQRIPGLEVEDSER